MCLGLGLERLKQLEAGTGRQAAPWASLSVSVWTLHMFVPVWWLQCSRIFYMASWHCKSPKAHIQGREEEEEREGEGEGKREREKNSGKMGAMLLHNHMYIMTCLPSPLPPSTGRKHITGPTHTVERGMT